jgi:calcineurin-like phosphoesterase family protein
MIWFTSDTHFNHFRIIEYTNRPFSSAEEMTETLIRNWNACVKPDDTIYHLGDVGFGQVNHVVNVMRRLAGHKFLIIGNHDHRNLKDPMFHSCFEWVKDYYELNAEKKRYILFHYPILSWNGRNHQSLHLSGHEHGRVDKYTDLHLDIGVDSNIAQYMPLSIHTVNAIMETKAKKMREAAK